MQIYNKLKQIPERPKASNTGKTKIPDYSKLFAMTVSGDFVKNASIHPRRKSDGQVESIDRSFCATNLMIKWLKLFCSPLRKIVTPTAFDMTYKCGPFYYVLLFTYVYGFSIPNVCHQKHDQASNIGCLDWNKQWKGGGRLFLYGVSA